MTAAGPDPADAAADRELRVERTLAAPVERVWAALADVSRMAARSPELVRIVPLLPGGLRRGQQYVGINRRGAVVWPTRSVVLEVVPLRRLVWDTRTSGARWVWELEPVDVEAAGEPGGSAGTRVVHRRPVPRRLTRAGGLFARVLLGGERGHADELQSGMLATLDALEAEVADG